LANHSGRAMDHKIYFLQFIQYKYNANNPTKLNYDN
jgi:hypothetical protein